MDASSCKMEKIEVTRGVYLLQLPAVGLSVLCGSPPDVIKHLMKRGFITERHWEGGVAENGPNAILLSDLPIQGGKFANMVEFPILQMFYRQGMILPGHPGNTGAKPLLIGLSGQLSAVSEYLFRGTYGLADIEEIRAAGIPADFAAEIVRIKLDFAFGSMRKSEDLLEFCPLDAGEASPRPGLVITRTGLNQYRFGLGGETVDVDLNLAEGETYPSPVVLGNHQIRHQYFSVLHLGEGDGWDTSRPCMSSAVMFQGKIYLIDTGPNILDSLTAAGISVNEIEGIFHTHAHDDHFAGLTSLVRTDHRIKHFATPLVRATIMKKLAAVMSLPEKRFMRSFEVHDLHFNKWNHIGGLEVMPVFSPHPVETHVLFFRTLWEGGYKTYAHLVDIATLEVLDRMLNRVPGVTDISRQTYKLCAARFAQTVDLKKIDIGGGMIHGCAADFAHDKSKKIVLGHLARELSPAEKEIGSEGGFGSEDVLIPGQRDYVRLQAERYLRSYFPTAPDFDLDLLLNCPIVSRNAGYILQKKGSAVRTVYLVVNGVAEAIQADAHLHRVLSAGTILGEATVFGEQAASQTWRAKSSVNVLEMPMELYLAFIRRNANLDRIKLFVSTTLFLASTRLFGEMVSSPVLNRIAREVEVRNFKAGQLLEEPGNPALGLVHAGSLELRIDGQAIDFLGPGDFFGEESIFFGGGNLISAMALEDCECWYINGKALREVPIVEWKMLEAYERRLTAYGTFHP